MSNKLAIGVFTGGNRLRLQIQYAFAAVGSSSAVGQISGVGRCVGTTDGAATAVAEAKTNRLTGTAFGGATVAGSIAFVMQVDGAASGVASAVAAGLSNRVVGLAFGSSTAQHFVQFSGLAFGTSTAVGAADAESKFRPKDLFLGYESDGTSITIPIASVIGLTDAEADTVTGDWREILQAVLLRSVEYHRSFVWSERLRTYNAFGMNLPNSRTFDRHFGITFYTDMGEPNVAQEP